MLSLDADQLYDLPEAARRLFCGPGWLERQARRRRVPWTWREGRMAFPRAWVDAEAGTAAADAEGLKTYFLERLAPASPDAARPLRDRSALATDALLAGDQAARRITADPHHLRRLVAEGVLPALRVDGEARYDAELIRLVGEAEPEAREQLAARRAAVLAWGVYEYGTGIAEGASPPPSTTRPAPAPAVAAAPRAWHVPDDLLAAEEDPSGDTSERPGLAEADGFETVDEDD